MLAFGIVCAVVAVALTLWNLRGAEGPAAGTEKAFFTVDDGKTTFVDSSERIPPFEHQGKQAVEARLFTPDGGKTTFVGYLVRYTETGKQRLAEMRRGGGRPTMGGDLLHNVEVKRPGEARWVRQSDPAGMAIVVVMCPGDRSRPADPVEP